MSATTNTTDISQAGRRYRISFNRVGRRRDVPELTTTVQGDNPAQLLAEALHPYVGRFLGSSEYTVAVDLEPDGSSGTGDIAGGRFGTFNFAEIGTAERNEANGKL
jgi:hypothetical protein